MSPDNKVAPSVPPVEAQLQEVIRSWRSKAMAAGQASVEINEPACTYAEAQAETWTNCADELQAVLAALPSPQGWQPIETAPKDGTRIRLLTPFCDAGGRRCYEMFTGSWQTNDFGSFWEDEECAEESHPEYWRPLDAAPVASPRGGPQANE